MNYPSINEYKQAILFAEETFEQLKNLRPVLDEDGEPVMTSGNFAVVFKMKDEQIGKLHAVKCFLREQEGRAEAYRLIAEELEYVSSTFLTPIKYLEKELFVDTNASDETEFPVLLMDWVDGVTLDKYIRENIYDEYALSMLAYQFSRLAMWIIPQPFAHGDLKPDNILVREDGNLVLVDYDGMYVPAMKGQKARELGSPDFRHPNRNETDFDEHIDDFSFASILLSLKTIALHPGLLEEYGASDRLLFSENDYRKISQSNLLKELFPSEDSELNVLTSLFMIALEKKNLSNVSFRLFDLCRPKEPVYVNLITEVTNDDWANAWTDEFGAKYSKDRKRLLHCYNDTIEEYTINHSTIVICDRAFFGCRSLSEIHISDFVTEIGGRAFSGCSSLSKIHIPNSVTRIGDFAFLGCVSLSEIHLPDYVTWIGEHAFNNCRSLSGIHIPDSISGIGDYAFYNCRSLLEIHIPNSVISIGDSAFCFCNSLLQINIPSSVNHIGSHVFDNCDSLKYINIPRGSYEKFKDLLPEYQDLLFDETLSTEVTEEDLANAWTDEYGVKYSADKKRLLHAPAEIVNYSVIEGTKVICNKAFKGCKDLLTVSIPNGVLSIGESAFWHRNRLKSVVLPDSVLSIGRLAFFGCSGLTTLTLSEKLRVIGDRAFFSCARISSIRIPSNVEQIGESAFQGCIGLKSMVVDAQNKTYDSRDYCHAIIETQSNTLLCGCSATIIPKSVVAIKDLAFVGVMGLKFIFIPDSVKTIGKSSFAFVSGIESIKVGRNNHYYDSRNNCNAIVETTSNTLLLGCPATIIPESVMKIGRFSFGDKTDRPMSIDIPEGVKEIEEKAFFNCLSLESIIISDSVEIIGNEAFSDCQYLKNVRLSSILSEIAKDLFAGCGRLEELRIPDNVTKIGVSAFYGCPVRNVIIPSNVKEIGDYAFNGCNNLTSIKITTDKVQVGEGVFQRCDNLTSICIPCGTKGIYEELLPEYKDKLVEQ